MHQERHTCSHDAVGRLTGLVRSVEKVLHRKEDFSCGELGDRDRSPQHEVYHEEVAELQCVEVVLELIPDKPPLDGNVDEGRVGVAQLQGKLMPRNLSDPFSLQLRLVRGAQDVSMVV